MNEAPEISSYLAKWQEIWPEHAVLRVFAPPVARASMDAWCALLFELHDCLFAQANDVVREQKSLWWANELQLMQAQQARHPITKMLQALQLPMQGIANAMLILLPKLPLLASNSPNLFQQLNAFSRSIASVEHVLFSGVKNSQPDCISLQWILLSWPMAQNSEQFALIPMHLRARYAGLDVTDANKKLLFDWAQELSVVSDVNCHGNWFRNAQNRFCKRRLHQLGKAKLPSLSVLHTLDAWRAMRQA